MISETQDKSKSSEPKLEKPSPSTQLLNNVELLVAMYEEQEQEQAAADANKPLDTTAIEKSVETAVNSTVAKAVQTAVSETISGSIEKALDDYLSRIDKRFDQLDDRINQFVDQLDKLDTNAQTFNARFDSLDEKINSAPPSSNLGGSETESLMSSQLNLIGADLADVILKFDNKFASLERTFQDQCKTVNGFYAKLSVLEGTRNEATTSPKTDAITEPVVEQNEPVPNADDSTSAWEKQKQAMLDQYGGSPDPQPAANAKSGESPSDQNNATETAIPTDTTEVEQLKSDLNSKLREAEVELSINRARLSQERAEFERNQAELDRRAAALDAKLAAMNSDDNGNDDDKGEAGLMNRFKRHLGS